MAIITRLLPIGGPGPYVDVSDMNHNRTFIFYSDTTDRVELEGNGDNNPARGSFVLSASNSRNAFVKDTSPFLRVNRKEGTTGNLVAFVAGEPAGPAPSRDVFAGSSNPDAAALDAYGPAVIYRANDQQTLRDVVVCFAAAVTGDPDNYAEVLVGIVDSSGTPVGVLGSLTTQVNRAQLVAYTLVLNPALLVIPDGNQVFFQVLKRGTGVVLDGVSVVGRVV